MRQRDDEVDSPGLGLRTRPPVQDQLRRPNAAAGHLDVTGAAATSERLDRRLLGGESGGEVAAGPPAAPGTCQLIGSEQPLGESGAPLQRPLDPGDLDQVDSQSGAGGCDAHGGYGVRTAADASSPSGASRTPSTKDPIVRSPSIWLPATT